MILHQKHYDDVEALRQDIMKLTNRRSRTTEELLEAGSLYDSNVLPGGSNGLIPSSISAVCPSTDGETQTEYRVAWDSLRTEWFYKDTQSVDWVTQSPDKDGQSSDYDTQSTDYDIQSLDKNTQSVD